jgi:hemophore-related protein
MVKLSSRKIIAGFVAAFGGAAMALTTSAGVASADPLVDTTCNYSQVIAALNATDPVLAQKLSGNPVADGMVRRFLNSDTAGRQEMVTQMSGSSWAQKYMGAMVNVAAVCNNY